MRHVFRIDFMPLWAGVALLIGATYILNVFLLPMVPFLERLPELGFITYGTTGTGLLGLWFAMKGEDERAEGATHICMLFGLLATVTGFVEYLMTFDSDATNYGGLRLAFIGTAHGFVMALTISFLLLWERRADSPSPNQP